MWKIAISLFIGVLLWAQAADAQFARQEVLAFESATMSTADFLTGKTGTPVTVAGYLRLPKANEKNPVVVILHSGGGLSAANASVNDWSQILNEAGIATFAIDSYSPRGVANLADAVRLSALTRIVDAYRALAVLSKHRLIDPDRIAVMGFSQGATAALYAGLERFQKSHGNQEMRFAAQIVLYGNCATRYNQDEVLARRPLLMLHGMADNSVSIEPCRDYASRLLKAGSNVRLIEYPDANHQFDSQNLREPIKLPQARSPAGCRYDETDNGAIVNVATRQPPSNDDSCFGKGVTFQYNETAARKSHEDVMAFLKDVFALK